MVVMALDHARDYFGQTPFDPTDLDKTQPPPSSSPAGSPTSAPPRSSSSPGRRRGFSRAKKSDSELAGFLLKRGCGWSFFEIVINNLCWSFDLTYSFMVLQVIWAIGLLDDRSVAPRPAHPAGDRRVRPRDRPRRTTRSITCIRERRPPGTCSGRPFTSPTSTSRWGDSATEFSIPLVPWIGRHGARVRVRRDLQGRRRSRSIAGGARACPRSPRASR